MSKQIHHASIVKHLLLLISLNNLVTKFKAVPVVGAESSPDTN
jgi:hypothetical protein